MTLADLVKTKANRVLGIDASTNSIAFCLMENDKPLKWGKINFVGQDIYEKIHDAKIKTSSMLDDSSGNSSIASEARVQEGGYILLPDGTEKYCPDQSFVYILP